MAFALEVVLYANKYQKKKKSLSFTVHRTNFLNNIPTSLQNMLLIRSAILRPQILKEDPTENKVLTFLITNNRNESMKFN